jgi:hypothetical protein
LLDLEMLRRSRDERRVRLMAMTNSLIPANFQNRQS